MPNFRQPILIAPRLGSISTPIPELFDRFDIYGRELCAVTGGQVRKLLVFGNLPNIESANRNSFLEYFYIGKNPIRQLIQTIGFLRRLEMRQYCFVAGDIWLGGIYVLFLRFLYRTVSKCQISIHGIPNFSSNFLIRRLKILIFRQLLSKVDSIRVVSQGLLEYLSKFGNVDTNRIFISPVPISLLNPYSGVPKTLDIAVVGRLHPERGISEAFQILERLLDFDPLLAIQFIGAGSLKTEVEKWQSSLIKPNRVIFSGELLNPEVLEILSRSRVLLSCAPEEGYGLSLREALMCGAFVVARKNSGTRELQQQYPKTVFLFETPRKAIDEIMTILKSNNENLESLEIFTKQKSLDKISLLRLANSWLY